MESLIPFTLFGSGILFGIAIVILFFTLIACDLTESGIWATTFVLIFLGLNYFWGTFDVSIILSFRNIGIYLFVGFLFSLIRTYFKGRELSKDEKKYFDLKNHVFRWWFLWPIAAINWVLGRLLMDLFDFVYKKISQLYTSIFNI